MASKNSRLRMPGEEENLPRGQWDGSEWQVQDAKLRRGRLVSPNKALEQAVTEYAAALNITEAQLIETAMKKYLIDMGYTWWCGPLDRVT